MSDDRAIASLLIAFFGFLGGYLGSRFKRQAEIDADYANMGKIAFAEASKAYATARAVEEAKLQVMADELKTVLSNLSAITRLTEEIKSDVAEKLWSNQKNREIKQEAYVKMLNSIQAIWSQYHTAWRKFQNNPAEFPTLIIDPDLAQMFRLARAQAMIFCSPKMIAALDEWTVKDIVLILHGADARSAGRQSRPLGPVLHHAHRLVRHGLEP